MLKALGRLGKDKVTFNVEVSTLELKIFSSQAFSCKLKISRGDQQKKETQQVKCERSMRNSDIKVLQFENDTFSFPCTFFIKEGKPEAKTCLFEAFKLFPGGTEVLIA